MQYRRFPHWGFVVTSPWGSSCHLDFTVYQIILDKNLCISMICNEVKATGGTKIGYYILFLKYKSEVDMKEVFVELRRSFLKKFLIEGLSRSWNILTLLHKIEIHICNTYYPCIHKILIVEFAVMARFLSAVTSDIVKETFIILFIFFVKRQYSLHAHCSKSPFL